MPQVVAPPQYNAALLGAVGYAAPPSPRAPTAATDPERERATLFSLVDEMRTERREMREEMIAERREMKEELAEARAEVRRLTAQRTEMRQEVDDARWHNNSWWWWNNRGPQ